ncbi:MAG: class I SAM-dependent methyltransferase [Deltaproteobacteria bacterium]
MDITTLNAYNKHAATFAKDWDEQPAPTDLRAVVRRYFRHGLTADVGCGSGRDTAWLSENGYPAIGFDPSQGLLKEARQRYPEVRFQHAALPDLDCAADGSFVNVLCETVIMHLEAEIIAPSVRKLMALLETGGTLYLSWRVTESSDRRDEYGRLYAAFDPSVVVQVLSTAKIILDEQKISASSGKTVHRIVVRKV